MMKSYEETLELMLEYAHGAIILYEISDPDLSNIIVALKEKIKKEQK